MRLLALGVRSRAHGARQAWQPGGDKVLRDLSVSYSTLTGVAALLTAGTVRLSG